MTAGVVAGEPIRAKATLPFPARVCCIVIFLRKLLEEGCQLPWKDSWRMRGQQHCWSGKSAALESTNGGIFHDYVSLLESGQDPFSPNFESLAFDGPQRVDIKNMTNKGWTSGSIHVRQGRQGQIFTNNHSNLHDSRAKGSSCIVDRRW